jgi:hypothetical protein
MPIPERVYMPGAPEPKDPSKKHFYISLVKSVVRIVAGVFLVMGNVVLAGFFLIAAEGLGILEEL